MGRYNPRGLFQFGDKLKQALDTIGITQDRVEAYLGRPCGCRDRQRKMNQIGQWVERILLGESTNAKEEFDKMVADEEPPSPGNPSSEK